MDIKTMLDKAVKYDQVDVQALLLFLTLEKQVLNMTDDIEALNLYFKPNNRNRMNQELTAYKNKMHMDYKPDVYKLTTPNETLYAYARNSYECNLMASTVSNRILSINACVIDEFALNGRFETIKDITRNKRVPCFLGGNHLEQLYEGG